MTISPRDPDLDNLRDLGRSAEEARRHIAKIQVACSCGSVRLAGRHDPGCLAIAMESHESPIEAAEDEIPMTPILGSSQIAMVGWKDDALDVTFNSGGLYRYAEVPREVAEALLAAQSSGRYLAQHVKGVYQYERLA